MGRSRLWSCVWVACSALLAALAFGSEVAARTDSHESASLRSNVCRAEVTVGVLPMWARAGFRDPNPQMPYVLGRAEQIAGILFGYPLRSPPRKGRNNKILWVSHVPTTPGSDLRISAQRMTGSEPVGSPVTRKVIGGPGPSIINLPAAGCWRLSLQWSGQSDKLDLRYGTSR
jgi:hypothetical protein